MENLPKGKNVILLSNHVSFFDPFLINGALPRFFNFIAVGRVIFNPYTFIALKGADIQTRSSHPLSGSKALVSAIKRINSGDNFLLFPSGKVIYSGNIETVNKALTRIISETETVVLPVKISNVMRAVFLQKPFHPRIIIGKPISRDDTKKHGSYIIKKSIESLQ